MSTGDTLSRRTVTDFLQGKPLEPTAGNSREFKGTVKALYQNPLTWEVDGQQFTMPLVPMARAKRGVSAPDYLLTRTLGRTALTAIEFQKQRRQEELALGDKVPAFRGVFDESRVKRCRDFVNSATRKERIGRMMGTLVTMRNTGHADYLNYVRAKAGDLKLELLGLKRQESELKQALRAAEPTYKTLQQELGDLTQHTDAATNQQQVADKKQNILEKITKIKQIAAKLVAVRRRVKEIAKTIAELEANQETAKRGLGISSVPTATPPVASASTSTDGDAGESNTTTPTLDPSTLPESDDTVGPVHRDQVYYDDGAVGFIPTRDERHPYNTHDSRSTEVLYHCYEEGAPELAGLLAKEREDLKALEPTFWEKMGHAFLSAIPFVGWSGTSSVSQIKETKRIYEGFLDAVEWQTNMHKAAIFEALQNKVHQFLSDDQDATSEYALSDMEAEDIFEYFLGDDNEGAEAPKWITRQETLDAVIRENKDSDSGQFRIRSIPISEKAELEAFLRQEETRLEQKIEALQPGSMPWSIDAHESERNQHQAYLKYVRQLAGHVRGHTNPVLDISAEQRFRADVATAYQRHIEGSGAVQQAETAITLSTTEACVSFLTPKPDNSLTAQAVSEEKATLRVRNVALLRLIIADVTSRLPSTVAKVFNPTYWFSFTDNSKQVAEDRAYLQRLKDALYALENEHPTHEVIKIVEQGNPADLSGRRSVSLDSYLYTATTKPLTVEQTFIQRFNTSRNSIQRRFEFAEHAQQRFADRFSILCRSKHGRENVFNWFREYYHHLKLAQKALWNQIIGLESASDLDTARKPAFLGSDETLNEFAGRFVGAFRKDNGSDTAWPQRRSAYAHFLRHMRGLPAYKDLVRGQPQYKRLVKMCLDSVAPERLTNKELLGTHIDSILPPYGVVDTHLLERGVNDENIEILSRNLRLAIRLAKRAGNPQQVYGLRLVYALVNGATEFGNYPDRAEQRPVVELLQNDEVKACLELVLPNYRIIYEDESPDAAGSAAQFLTRKYTDFHIQKRYTELLGPEKTFAELLANLPRLRTFSGDLAKYRQLVSTFTPTMGKGLNHEQIKFAKAVVIAALKADNGQEFTVPFAGTVGTATADSSVENKRLLVTELAKLATLEPSDETVQAVRKQFDIYLQGKLYTVLRGLVDDGLDDNQTNTLTDGQANLIYFIAKHYQGSGEQLQLDIGELKACLEGADFISGISADDLIGYVAQNSNVQACLNIVLKKMLGDTDDSKNLRKAVIKATQGAESRVHDGFDGQSSQYAAIALLLGTPEQQAGFARKRFLHLLSTANTTTGNKGKFTAWDDEFFDRRLSKRRLATDKENLEQPMHAEIITAVKLVEKAVEESALTYIRCTKQEWNEAANTRIDAYCSAKVQQFYRLKGMMEQLRSPLAADFDDATHLVKATISSEVKDFLTGITAAGYAYGSSGRAFDLTGDVGEHVREQLTAFLDELDAKARADVASVEEQQAYSSVAGLLFSRIAQDDLVERLRLNQFEYYLLKAQTNGTSYSDLRSAVKQFEDDITAWDDELSLAVPRVCSGTQSRSRALEVVKTYIANRSPSAPMGAEAVPLLLAMGLYPIDGLQEQLEIWLAARLQTKLMTAANGALVEDDFDTRFLDFFLLYDQNYNSGLQIVFDKIISKYVQTSDYPWNQQAHELIEKYASAENKQLYRIKHIHELINGEFSSGYQGEDKPREYTMSAHAKWYYDYLRQNPLGASGDVFDLGATVSIGLGSGDVQQTPEKSIQEILRGVLETYLQHLANEEVPLWEAATAEVDASQATSSQSTKQQVTGYLEKWAFGPEQFIGLMLQDALHSMQLNKMQFLLVDSQSRFAAGTREEESVKYAGLILAGNDNGNMSTKNELRLRDIFEQHLSQANVGSSCEFTPLAMLFATPAEKLTYLRARWDYLVSECVKDGENAIKLSELDRQFFAHIKKDAGLYRHFNELVRAHIYDKNEQTSGDNFRAWTTFVWNQTTSELIQAFASPANYDIYKAKGASQLLAAGLTTGFKGAGYAKAYELAEGTLHFIDTQIKADQPYGGFTVESGSFDGRDFLVQRLADAYRNLLANDHADNWNWTYEVLLNALTRAGGQDTPLLDGALLEQLQLRKAWHLLTATYEHEGDPAKVKSQEVRLYLLRMRCPSADENLLEHFNTSESLETWQGIDRISLTDVLERYIAETQVDTASVETFTLDKHAEELFAALAPKAQLQDLRRFKVAQLLHCNDLASTDAYLEIVGASERPSVDISASDSVSHKRVPIVFEQEGEKALDALFDEFTQQEKHWSLNTAELISATGTPERFDAYTLKRVKELLDSDKNGDIDAPFATERFVNYLLGRGDAYQNLFATEQGLQAFDELMQTYISSPAEPSSTSLRMLLRFRYPRTNADASKRPLYHLANVKRFAEVVVGESPCVEVKSDGDLTPKSQRRFLLDESDFWQQQLNLSGLMGRFGEANFPKLLAILEVLFAKGEQLFVWSPDSLDAAKAILTNSWIENTRSKVNGDSVQAEALFSEQDAVMLSEALGITGLAPSGLLELAKDKESRADIYIFGSQELLRLADAKAKTTEVNAFASSIAGVSAAERGSSAYRDAKQRYRNEFSIADDQNKALRARYEKQAVEQVARRIALKASDSHVVKALDLANEVYTSYSADSHAALARESRAIARGLSSMSSALRYPLRWLSEVDAGNEDFCRYQPDLKNGRLPYHFPEIQAFIRLVRQPGIISLASSSSSSAAGSSSAQELTYETAINVLRAYVNVAEQVRASLSVKTDMVIKPNVSLGQLQAVLADAKKQLKKAQEARDKADKKVSESPENEGFVLAANNAANQVVQAEGLVSQCQKAFDFSKTYSARALDFANVLIALQTKWLSRTLSSVIKSTPFMSSSIRGIRKEAASLSAELGDAKSSNTELLAKVQKFFGDYLFNSMNGLNYRLPTDIFEQVQSAFNSLLDKESFDAAKVYFTSILQALAEIPDGQPGETRIQDIFVGALAALRQPDSHPHQLLASAGGIAAVSVLERLAMHEYQDVRARLSSDGVSVNQAREALASLRTRYDTAAAKTTFMPLAEVDGITWHNETRAIETDISSLELSVLVYFSNVEALAAQHSKFHNVWTWLQQAQPISDIDILPALKGYFTGVTDKQYKKYEDIARLLLANKEDMPKILKAMRTVVNYDSQDNAEARKVIYDFAKANLPALEALFGKIRFEGAYIVQNADAINTTHEKVESTLQQLSSGKVINLDITIEDCLLLARGLDSQRVVGLQRSLQAFLTSDQASVLPPKYFARIEAVFNALSLALSTGEVTATDDGCKPSLVAYEDFVVEYQTLLQRFRTDLTLLGSKPYTLGTDFFAHLRELAEYGVIAADLNELSTEMEQLSSTQNNPAAYEACQYAQSVLTGLEAELVSASTMQSHAALILERYAKYSAVFNMLRKYHTARTDTNIRADVRAKMLPEHDIARAVESLGLQLGLLPDIGMASVASSSMTQAPNDAVKAHLVAGVQEWIETVYANTSSDTNRFLRPLILVFGTQEQRQRYADDLLYDEVQDFVKQLTSNLLNVGSRHAPTSELISAEQARLLWKFAARMNAGSLDHKFQILLRQLGSSCDSVYDAAQENPAVITQAQTLLTLFEDKVDRHLQLYSPVWVKSLLANPNLIHAVGFKQVATTLGIELGDNPFAEVQAIKFIAGVLDLFPATEARSESEIAMQKAKIAIQVEVQHFVDQSLKVVESPSRGTLFERLFVLKFAANDEQRLKAVTGLKQFVNGFRSARVGTSPGQLEHYMQSRQNRCENAPQKAGREAKVYRVAKFAHGCNFTDLDIAPYYSSPTAESSGAKDVYTQLQTSAQQAYGIGIAAIDKARTELLDTFETAASVAAKEGSEAGIRALADKGYQLDLHLPLLARSAVDAQEYSQIVKFAEAFNAVSLVAPSSVAVKGVYSPDVCQIRFHSSATRSDGMGPARRGRSQSFTGTSKADERKPKPTGGNRWPGRGRRKPSADASSSSSSSASNPEATHTFGYSPWGGGF